MQEKPKNKFLIFYDRIKYAIIPFFIFVAVLLVSYFGNQILYNILDLPASSYPEIPADSKVPLVSWFVYFYYLTFPLGLITFFYIAYKDKAAFYNLFYTLILSFALSGFIYLFAQTYFTKPDFTPVSFTDKLVVWTWGSTNPINCFPSQHCFMAFAVIIACLSCKGMKMWYRLGAIGCSIMIVLSTVFIRQHFILDIFASFDIMFIIFAIFYCCDFGKNYVKKQRIKKKKQQNKQIIEK